MPFFLLRSRHHFTLGIQSNFVLCSDVSASRSSFYVQSTFQRCLHTPPGGFQESLPPSFGRSGVKGELSSVNLKSKRAKWRWMRTHKKPLLIPDHHLDTRGVPPTLDQTKSNSQQFIKKSEAYCGHLRQQEQDMRFVSESLTSHDMVEQPVSYDARVDASCSLHQEALIKTGGKDKNAREEVDLENICTSKSDQQAPQIQTLVEAAISNFRNAPHSPCGASDVNDDIAAATRTSTIFSLTAIPPKTGASHCAGGQVYSWEREQALEQRFAVVPKSTVFGSDLDRLERDMIREFEQHGKTLPRTDSVFTQFGGGVAGKRMTWVPSSSFEHLKGVDKNQKRANVFGDAYNRNLSAYHMSAEAYREVQEARPAQIFSVEQTTGDSSMSISKGINYCKNIEASLYNSERGTAATQQKQLKENDGGELEAEDNPHFPVVREGLVETDSIANKASEKEDGGHFQSLSMTCQHVVVDASTDYKPVLTTVKGGGDMFEYDAYKQRPVENKVLELRGVDYWSNFENRRKLEAHIQYRNELFEMEKLQEGAMDTSEVEYSVNRVRKEALLYFQAHPINEMIQESFVRIREIAPNDGSERIVFNFFEDLQFDREGCEALEKLKMDVDVPVQEARRMAQELGLDLVRIGCIHTQNVDRRVVALCLIGDHREHMRSMIKFKIQKLGVRPPPTKPCIEVPFRGGTHPHAIRFKCVGIAKHILHRHSIRINLTDFGTPREGFPVFQSILDEVKRQCIQLRAFHKAGAVQSNYNEIFCYLYPSTGRSPKTTVHHPSPQYIREAQEISILENEKEIYFDDLCDQPTVRDRINYLTKLEKGTAWADKDEGLSLRKQRAMKVMLGYLPKGNKDIYAARGDVNIPAPFRASHPTSIEKWSHPLESNLEQASRGAAVLGKRAMMPISEMHDRGETPENPSQLDRFYYKLQGPALEVGEFKEALGLKDNRRKRPPLAGVLQHWELFLAKILLHLDKRLQNRKIVSLWIDLLC